MKENPNITTTDTPKTLYPAIEPFQRQMLEVSGGHQIYVEECGNPKGLPVVVFHGGPGGGCSPGMRRFFDPARYHIILFDQRGCGRSKPHASVENNTTWDLISDIEQIRKKLRINRWVVFGGSWGACLALLYAQAHPDRVKALVLRGVFTMTRAELDWFYGGGAGKFWPEQWRRFSHMVPADERTDLIQAYHQRLFGEDAADQAAFSSAWAAWENSVAVLEPKHHGTPSGPYARAFSRIENHYFINNGFLDTDEQILENMGIIAHIPGHIVQGRYDMICPPYRANAVHKAWFASHLHMAPTAGHSLSEPGIITRLLSITDALAV